MSISRRAVALVGLAIPLVFLWPSTLTVLRWVLVCAVLVAVDVALASNPRQLRISRRPLSPVRLGEESESVIDVQMPTLDPIHEDVAEVGHAGAVSGAGVGGGDVVEVGPGAAAGGAATSLTTPDPDQRHVTGEGTPRPRQSWQWKLARVDVRDAWPWSAHAVANRHTLKARQAEDARWVVRTTLRPSRRGALKSDLVTARSWGPLRLAARQVTLRAEQTLRVLPQFPSRNYLPRALTKLQQIEGHALALRPGQGTEFDSLREWVEGDDVRSIDWRASARSDDKLIVRTWRPERDRHLVMVLDTSRLCAVRVGETARLDAHMDAILLLSAVAAKAQDSVSLVAGDRVIHRELRKPEARNILESLSHAMVGLEPAMVEADWVHLARNVLAQKNKVSLVVLFTSADPAPVRESLLPVLTTLAPQMRVVIACASVKAAPVEGISDAEDVFQRAASAQLAQQRARVGSALAAIGVDVIEAPAAELAMEVVEHYLALKARGEL